MATMRATIAIVGLLAVAGCQSTAGGGTTAGSAGGASGTSVPFEATAFTSPSYPTAGAVGVRHISTIPVIGEVEGRRNMDSKLAGSLASAMLGDEAGMAARMAVLKRNNTVGEAYVVEFQDAEAAYARSGTADVSVFVETLAREFAAARVCGEAGVEAVKPVPRSGWATGTRAFTGGNAKAVIRCRTA